MKHLEFQRPADCIRSYLALKWIWTPYWPEIYLSILKPLQINHYIDLHLYHIKEINQFIGNFYHNKSELFEMSRNYMSVELWLRIDVPIFWICFSALSFGYRLVLGVFPEKGWNCEYPSLSCFSFVHNCGTYPGACIPGSSSRVQFASDMLIEHALATSWNFSIAQRPIFWVKAAEAAEALNWFKIRYSNSDWTIVSTNDRVWISFLKTHLQLEVFHFQGWYLCSNSNLR